MIQARRESGSLEPDVLQTFIDARYKDGSKLTNDQVLGMLIAVLFAGQHTSSITSTWTGLLAIANKERVMPYLEQEQQKIMKKHGTKIDFDVLAEMDELHFAVKEALRMHPPLIMLLRKAQVLRRRPPTGRNTPFQRSHLRHLSGVCPSHGLRLQKPKHLRPATLQIGRQQIRLVHRLRRRSTRMHGRNLRLHANQNHLVRVDSKL